MTVTRKRRRPRSRRPDLVHKPRGVIHPRVQQVGPEHFGIVSVDCAKARSKWMLADFYGNVLVPPTVVAHDQAALDGAVQQLRQACAARDLREVLVALERTGRYHQIPQRAYAAAGFETRIVHPFATKQFRQPCDPGHKTDDTDLHAIHRAAVNGFALQESSWSDAERHLQLLIRHRRDLVEKMAKLCCQAREHLATFLPGYAECFTDFWDSNVSWHLVQHYASPQAFWEAGRAGLTRLLQDDQVRFQQRTLTRLIAWAETAASGDGTAVWHQRIALALNRDRLQKTLEIQALERESAALLVQTPYVLLLAFPGINVVSAADFAGEMGPISTYANSRCITGRAGLYPARYQSDLVDHANGPLVRCANRRLRYVILTIADNLICCNHHFNVSATRWHAQGKDPRHTRVKVALRFCRIAYQIVAGRQLFRHPAMQQRSYILDKLLAFHREHDTPLLRMQADLEAAVAQLPRSAYAREARPLADELCLITQGRRRGPQLIGDILPIVLARLGVGPIQSIGSGESNPT